MLRIAIINESFHNPWFYRRWQQFAEVYKDCEVTLITPQKDYGYTSKNNTFGKAVFNTASDVDFENFHIRTINIKRVLSLGWISNNLRTILEDVKPNIIYNIGTHLQLSLVQVIKLRNKHFRNAKLISFSMRGPAFDVNNFMNYDGSLTSFIRRRVIYYNYAKLVLNIFNKNIDAVFCHYPDAVECFKKEGYNGPIYMQTQVGVNPEYFHEDLSARKIIRDKYKVEEDEYLFGSATRFSIAKGVDDVLNALPTEGKWKYLLMGSGRDDEVRRIKSLIEEKGLTDKVIMTGYINLTEMPDYWNAIDCAFHVPRTSLGWVETFSIALVQAMITKKPIIASDSGSVPYQVGPEGLIIHEGDVNELREKILWVLDHRAEAKEIGNKMYNRANACFNTNQLNALFHETIVHDIMNNVFDIKKSDMTKWPFYEKDLS